MVIDVKKTDEEYKKIIDELNNNTHLVLKKKLLKIELDVKILIYNEFLKRNRDNKDYESNCLWLLNKLRKDIEIKSMNNFDISYKYKKD